MLILWLSFSLSIAQDSPRGALAVRRDTQGTTYSVGPRLRRTRPNLYQNPIEAELNQLFRAGIDRFGGTPIAQDISADNSTDVSSSCLSSFPTNQTEIRKIYGWLKLKQCFDMSSSFFRYYYLNFPYSEIWISTQVQAQKNYYRVLFNDFRLARQGWLRQSRGADDQQAQLVRELSRVSVPQFVGPAEDSNPIQTLQILFRKSSDRTRASVARLILENRRVPICVVFEQSRYCQLIELSEVLSPMVQTIDVASIDSTHWERSKRILNELFFIDTEDERGTELGSRECRPYWNLVKNHELQVRAIVSNDRIEGLGFNLKSPQAAHLLEHSHQDLDPEVPSILAQIELQFPT